MPTVHERHLYTVPLTEGGLLELEFEESVYGTFTAHWKDAGHFCYVHRQKYRRYEWLYVVDVVQDALDVERAQRAADVLRALNKIGSNIRLGE